MIQRCAAVACLLIAAGCSDSTVTVDVFAASSLTDAFTELEKRFEAENPGTDIRLNLAGSDTLRRQIDDGAEAEIFAPAAIELFDGLDVSPTPYATTQLDIVINSDGRLLSSVESGDLSGLVVARCSPGVPCGDAADRLIESLGLDLSDATVTSEPNVRAVLSKVELGEADVGFVYRSDVTGTDSAGTAADVTALGLDIEATRVTLAIAAVPSGDSAADEAAAAFVAFVIGEASQPVFFGFDPAP